MRGGLILLGGIIIVAAILGLTVRSDAAPPNLREHIEISLPEEADEPVPALVLLSGCGGVRQIQADYAAVANDAGWAAVVVDSFAARGIGRLGARTTVCTGLRMRGEARAADIFATLDLVRADPRMKADRLALIGWSHGGWAILDAMALTEAGDAPEDALAGVRGAFAIYPYCGALSRADTDPIGDDIPLTILNVGRDRVVSAQACRDMVVARAAEGALITAIEEPDLTHAFDAQDQPFDPRMRYDAEGAARTHARLTAFLNDLKG